MGGGLRLFRRKSFVEAVATGVVPPCPPVNSLDGAIHTQENPPQERFSVGCSSPFMRLT